MPTERQDTSSATGFPQRRNMVLVGLLVVACVLCWRAVDLQVVSGDGLRKKADRRHLGTVTEPAHRGMITDRNGEPLAVSTQVFAVIANPRRINEYREDNPELAERLTAQLGLLEDVLKLPKGRMTTLLEKRANSRFVYLERQLPPVVAQQVKALDLPGVDLQKEFRRYYPSNEIFSHVIGVTNIDDQGQSGLEKTYDAVLRGEPGKTRVMRDGRRRAIEEVEDIAAPRPGENLVLSLDRRIQYLAYKELTAAVKRHEAVSGSLVMLDVKTGEILAMVNQPTYNPHRRDSRPDMRRNRAVTDVYEPGSTLKPFTVAAGLSSGKYRPNTLIDTGNGQYPIARMVVKDTSPHGVIDVSTVLQKSSNVGVTKIALSLPKESQWQILARLGFGEQTGSGFLGERSGRLMPFSDWREIDRVTLSYGYGASATALQIARAYAALADDGRIRPTSFLKVDHPVGGEQAMEPSVAREVRTMLEAVVAPGGTATRAAIPGYRVAGKTGTAKKVINGKYAKKRYVSMFAGLAPASDPRLVTVVVVDDPRKDGYYGGKVAAPVFSRVMEGALRMLDIAPDNLPGLNQYVRGEGDSA